MYACNAQPTDSHSNCSAHAEETPLTCEVLEYIEQYVIVENSATTHDPLRTPLCPKPDLAHCLSIDCNWPSGPYHSMAAKMELLPCSKPPGVKFTVSNSQEGALFNHTFQQSETVKFNAEVSLNVTLTHPQEGVIGLEVAILIVCSSVECPLLNEWLQVVSVTTNVNLTQISSVRIPLPACSSNLKVH